MIRSLGPLGLLVVATACASSGGPGGDSNVPVYFAAEDVPCAYEVVRTVRGQSQRQFRSEEDYQRELERVLGRAGGRAGADAVLTEYTRGARGVAVRREVREGGPPPSSTFEGQALRYTDPACAGGG